MSMPLLKQLKKRMTSVEDIKADKINIITGIEFETGRTIDGKIEYGKRIAVPELPNATYITIQTGTKNVNISENGLIGTFQKANVVRTYPEGRYSAGVSLGMIMYYNSTNGIVTLACQGDASGFSGYTTIYYTKN